MPDRLSTYAAALLIDWYAGKSGRAYALASSQERDGVPVFTAASPEGALAIAIARLYEAEADPAADDARAMMEDRLDAGAVRGPYMIWVPPRASVPADEPDQSDFVQRVQRVAAPILAGARAEIDLPAPVQLAKMRDEGGYASVIGGLSRWWTLITERVHGTFHVNSSRVRRAPQSAATREALFDRIGELSKPLGVGDAIEFDAVESWTLQRLPAGPLGVTGFAIVQAPPKIDPADGTLIRRLVRKRLRDASDALQGVDADIKGVGLIGIYEYAEHENIGSFVKSVDPGVFSKLPLVAALVDGDVRPIFLPRP